MPLGVNLRVTNRFSSSTQKRCDWMFGKKRRLVLLLACDTLFPVIGRLPVTWHTLDMILLQRIKPWLGVICLKILTGCVKKKKKEDDASNIYLYNPALLDKR